MNKISETSLLNAISYIRMLWLPTTKKETRPKGHVHALSGTFRVDLKEGVCNLQKKYRGYSHKTFIYPRLKWHFHSHNSILPVSSPTNTEQRSITERKVKCYLSVTFLSTRRENEYLKKAKHPLTQDCPPNSKHKGGPHHKQLNNNIVRLIMFLLCRKNIEMPRKSVT